MTVRSQGVPLWLSLRRRLAAVLVLLAGGCAAISPETSGQSWVEYFAGADLAETCTPGSREVFRVAFYDREPPLVRLFEITEQAAGGAAIAARTLAPDEIRHISARDAWDSRAGDASDLTLAPLAFAQLARRLDDIGAFDMPVFGPPRRPPQVRWLITGCHGGEWFFNAFAAPSELGLPISLR